MVQLSNLFYEICQSMAEADTLCVRKIDRWDIVFYICCLRTRIMKSHGIGASTKLYNNSKASLPLKEREIMEPKIAVLKVQVKWNFKPSSFNVSITLLWRRQFWLLRHLSKIIHTLQNIIFLNFKQYFSG